MKHFTLSLALLLLALMPAMAHADVSYIEQYGIMYQIDFDPETYTGTAAVLSCNEENLSSPVFVDSVLYVPEWVEEYPVTKIIGGEGFADCDFIKMIQLPYSITTIEEDAFNGMKNLVSVDFDNPYYLPPSLEIGRRAFANCAKLEGVEFNGKPISSLGECAFLNCTSMRSVYMHNNKSTVTSVPRGCFGGCTSLYRVVLPNSVTQIGEGAFMYCTTLNNINLPHLVTQIGKYAFAECSSLEYLSLDEGLTTIEEATFLKCTSLQSIIIPNSVTSIGELAFTACYELTRATIGNSVTSIGKRAFSGCYALPYIEIPNSVTSIGEHAFFAGKVAVNGFTTNRWDISPSIGSMVEGFSEDNGSLKNIYIGNGLTSIGGHAFIGQIPETISCMAPTPPALLQGSISDKDVFDALAYDSTTLRVPRVMVNAYREAEGWKKFSNITGIEVLGNGDTNDDGRTSINDVMGLIGTLLGNSPDAFNAINADVNGDGILSITDVTRIIEMLLNSGR